MVGKTQGGMERFMCPYLGDRLVACAGLVNLLFGALGDLLLGLNVVGQGLAAADHVDGIFVFEDVALAVRQHCNYVVLQTAQHQQATSDSTPTCEILVLTHMQRPTSNCIPAGDPQQPQGPNSPQSLSVAVHSLRPQARGVPSLPAALASLVPPQCPAADLPSPHG